ncbi:hypothetical protein I79_002342 [Cricetulus griseus]|uniref:Uncharacterized protein n=1 Tax=Cricetulus griseus TaxID=10029 RepID=G3GX30_CRIGR|nr:hypothetical protein I79_002342 [Cricetulus griseus]
MRVTAAGRAGACTVPQQQHRALFPHHALPRRPEPWQWSNACHMCPLPEIHDDIAPAAQRGSQQFGQCSHQAPLRL